MEIRYLDIRILNISNRQFINKIANEFFANIDKLSQRQNELK